MNRDDLIKDNEYALSAYHDEEQGKAIRKKVWKVTAILSGLTIVEVFMGIYLSERGTMTWQMVKWGFIIMTLFKAGLIVMEFMHLGHEKKTMKWLVLAPYIGFIAYLVFICLTEAAYVFDGFWNYGA
jgi:cytochrome c oxidase subunit IV